jgi:hypothetical protein
MADGGRPEVPGYLRYQLGQILQTSKPAGSAGTTMYMGAPEEDGIALYKSGTRDKEKALV